MSDKSKNDGKKARTFDLDQMFGVSHFVFLSISSEFIQFLWHEPRFQEAKMVAEQRRHESDANRAEEEAKRAIIDEEGEEVSDSSNRLKISCSIDGLLDLSLFWHLHSFFSSQRHSRHAAAEHEWRRCRERRWFVTATGHLAGQRTRQHWIWRFRDCQRQGVGAVRLGGRRSCTFQLLSWLNGGYL